MATIYDINNALYSLIDEETGEIKDFEAFEKLQLDREIKIENTALWIKDLLGDAEKIKAEKEMLAEREKKLRNRAESLKRNIDFALAGEKFETPKCQIGYTKSRKCVIADEDKFMEAYPEFVKETVTKKISLTDVTKALKADTEIEGAELVECNNIQIK